MFKKTLRSLTLCVGALIVANSFAEDSSKELYIYNWNEYIDPQVIPDFEKETGIKGIKGLGYFNISSDDTLVPVEVYETEN